MDHAFGLVTILKLIQTQIEAINVSHLNFAPPESPPPSVRRGAARPRDGEDRVHLRRGSGRRVRLCPLAAAGELRRPQRRHHHFARLHAPSRAQGAPQGRLSIFKTISFDHDLMRPRFTLTNTGLASDIYCILKLEVPTREF